MQQRRKFKGDKPRYLEINKIKVKNVETPKNIGGQKNVTRQKYNYSQYT